MFYLLNFQVLNIQKKILLLLLPGLLFWAAWPPQAFIPLVFVAFIPLFFFFQHYFDAPHRQSILHFATWIYFAMLLWNILTTWWIWNAAYWGSIPAFTLNALLMTVPWILGFITAKKRGLMYGYCSLPVFWLAFEYIHLQWELTWPWLTLGNSFAAYPILFQWYEYTGHLGGSVWVWAVNLSLYFTFFYSPKIFNKYKAIGTTLFILFFPVLLSIALYFQYQEKGTPVNITIVQPNIDPYEEKFSFAYFEKQWQDFIQLSTENSYSDTRFILWPETAMPGRIWKHQIENSLSLKRIDSMLHKMPQAQLITGADYYERYDSPQTPTARYFQYEACCYDAFNTALQIDTSGFVNYYHKSKLVPGVERMPYPQLFGFLEKFSIDLGGTSGSLATQEKRTVFETSDNMKFGAAICYESVFGDFMAEFVRAGAQAIFIITNDAWWGNTPGHQQHLAYASLRAVELRKSIARSANTGISCFINQKGEIFQATKYDTQTAIHQNILFNATITFYARYGDIIGRIALFLSLYFLMIPWIKKIREKRNQLK